MKSISLILLLVSIVTAQDNAGLVKDVLSGVKTLATSAKNGGNQLVHEALCGVGQFLTGTLDGTGTVAENVLDGVGSALPILKPVTKAASKVTESVNAVGDDAIVGLADLLQGGTVGATKLVCKLVDGLDKAA